MGQQVLFDSPIYKRFIAYRDRALEQINLNAQTDLSRILFEALDRIEQTLTQLSIRSSSQALLLRSQQFEAETLSIFSNVIYPIVDRIKRMRRTAFILSYLAELEAIGQSTQKSKIIDLQKFKKKLTEIEESPNFNGEDLSKRVWLALMKMRSKIVDRFKLSLVQELPPQEIVDSVKAAFPKVVTYLRPPRELKPLREADSDPKKKKEFFFDFLDEDDWNLVVQAYKDTELPLSRFDDAAQYAPDNGYARYS